MSEHTRLSTQIARSVNQFNCFQDGLSYEAVWKSSEKTTDFSCILSYLKQNQTPFSLGRKRNVLLRVCFSLEIRSSTNFSSNYLWRTYLLSLILQRLPCSVSLALFSLSYIGSFYVWQFFYYQISFWIRFPPCLITSVLLCVCSLFLFPSDNSLISRFGFAFVSCFLVLFSWVLFLLFYLFFSCQGLLFFLPLLSKGIYLAFV